MGSTSLPGSPGPLPPALASPAPRPGPADRMDTPQAARQPRPAGASSERTGQVRGRREPPPRPGDTGAASTSLCNRLRGVPSSRARWHRGGAEEGGGGSRWGRVGRLAQGQEARLSATCPRAGRPASLQVPEGNSCCGQTAAPARAPPTWPREIAPASRHLHWGNSFRGLRWVWTRPEAKVKP